MKRKGRMMMFIKIPLCTMMMMMWDQKRSSVDRPEARWCFLFRSFFFLSVVWVESYHDDDDDDDGVDGQKRGLRTPNETRLETDERRKDIRSDDDLTFFVQKNDSTRNHFLNSYLVLISSFFHLIFLLCSLRITIIFTMMMLIIIRSVHRHHEV